MDKSSQLRDNRLWHKMDELARRLNRQETLTKETRRKVALIEKHLGIHARDDTGEVLTEGEMRC